MPRRNNGRSEAREAQRSGATTKRKPGFAKASAFARLRRDKTPRQTPSTQRRREHREPQSFFFYHGWTRINLTRLAPQPRNLDCGGKRSATPILDANDRTKSGVAAALQSSLRFASAGCHRSPNLCYPCAKLQDCIMDKGEMRIS
jgi:hypothetical protein